MKFELHQLAIVVAVAVVTLAAASPAPSASTTEGLLASAGFKTKRADTAARKHQLEILPEGKMSVVHENGKTYYVYTDWKHKQIYVGNKGQYEKFEGELKRQPDADAIVKKIYRRGQPIEVREFHGFEPLPE